MRMTDADICREYREAKNKKMQVTILADQNLCAKGEIARILIRNGMNVTPIAKNAKHSGIKELLYAMLDEQEGRIMEEIERYKKILKSIELYGRE